MTIKPFTRSELVQLLANIGGPHLSLFLSPPVTINEANQDQIRIGNLARQAHETLVKYWMSDIDAGAFLQPLQSFANDSAVLRARRHGIALFLCDDLFAPFRAETAIKEQWFVARAFHVRPLLPSLEQLEAYCVLTLSQKRVALFAGRQHALERVAVQGLPESFEQLQESLTAEPRSQSHSGAVGHHTKQGAVFHGQGGIPDVEKIDFQNYFRRVDDSVCSYLRQHSNVPLILAGVDSVVAMFRSISRGDSTLADSISGNVDHLSADELRSRASSIVDGEADRRREQQGRRIREHDVPTATDPEQILIAASEGRIDTLFIDQEATLHGVFMADRGILKELHHGPTGDPAEASHDLIELAAVQTLKAGGRVHLVSADRMPIAKKMAAGLRF